MKTKLLVTLMAALPLGGYSQDLRYLVAPTDFVLSSSTTTGVDPFADLGQIADGITNSSSSSNGVVFSPLPATFTFTFSEVMDLSGFSMFTQVQLSGAQGVKEFGVEFFDAGGLSLGSLAGEAVNVGNNWQDWTFAEIQGVQSAVLTAISGLSTSNDPEISEVRFYGTPQIPEPSTSLLALIGSSFAFLRRRR